MEVPSPPPPSLSSPLRKPRSNRAPIYTRRYIDRHEEIRRGYRTRSSVGRRIPDASAADIEISPRISRVPIKSAGPTVANFKSGWLDAYQLTSAVNVPIKAAVQRAGRPSVQTPRRRLHNSQVSLRERALLLLPRASENTRVRSKLHARASVGESGRGRESSREREIESSVRCTRETPDFRNIPDLASARKKRPDKHLRVL